MSTSRSILSPSAFLLLAVSVRCWGDVPPNAPALQTPASLDEVLVTGERPGPGMWRVSKGAHDLWILATLQPLPKNMTWRSQVVEQRIASSQVVISPPQVDADIGFFRGLTLIPSLLRARKSPDGRTLEQLLSHDLYIRWLALRVKYLGSGDDEHKRPMLAALDLYERALDQSGLTSNETVWSTIEKTAHKDHVPLQPVVLNLKVDDAKGAIRDLNKIPQEAEIACFTKTMERLETDLGPMRQRANFWSLGDIAGLRSLPYPDEEVACLNAFLAVPEFREPYERARKQIADLWLSTADAALESNSSSFAVLPISLLLREGGVLDRLRAKGYAVQEPQ
jgi:TraB/PrgY/gumN family